MRVLVSLVMLLSLSCAHVSSDPSCDPTRSWCPVDESWVRLRQDLVGRGQCVGQCCIVGRGVCCFDDTRQRVSCTY